MADDTIKDHIVEDIKAHKLDNEIIEVEVLEENNSMQMLGGMGMEINISEMLGGILPKKKRKKLKKISS